MNGGMPGVGKWLRPPRSILIFFVLVVCVPAATLIAFGIRLLDQDRALAHQRRLELLDRAADQGVHVLEQDLAARAKRLLGAPCALDELPDDAVCVVLHSGSDQRRTRATHSVLPSCASVEGDAIWPVPGARIE